MGGIHDSQVERRAHLLRPQVQQSSGEGVHSAVALASSHCQNSSPTQREFFYKYLNICCFIFSKKKIRVIDNQSCLTSSDKKNSFGSKTKIISIYIIFNNICIGCVNIVLRSIILLL